jgi:sugar/nucleoside kinase (ribokinase family)
LGANRSCEVIAAGHICLDVIPTIGRPAQGLDRLLQPGKLVHVGPAVTSTGGAVSNTGIALHRLGVAVRLMGKVGDDLFGRAILDLLRGQGPQLAEGMIVVPGEATSYTVVISPPGVDRVFLHCPGTNDTFGAADVDLSALGGARLFHFGYPPLMKRMYENGGAELAELLRKVKEAGLTVSMDMAKPDPNSEAGAVDWKKLLAAVLPHVDVFLPSFDELLFMLNRPLFDRFAEQGDDLGRHADEALLNWLSGSLLEMGAAVAAIKLGENGLYMRTTSDRRRIERMGAAKPANPDAWLGRELLAECYRVEVAGTTGAGDCTIAGWLCALLKGLNPEEALQSAVAAGACNVERADATSGIPAWEAVQARMQAGWEKRPHDIALPHWRYDAAAQLWFGPADGAL